MSIAEYLEWYVLYIPKAVYGWGLAGFLLVLIAAVLWGGKKEGIRFAVAFLLTEYVALLLYFTVFIRRSTGVYEYMLMPFWSYRAMLQSTRVLAQEALMNVAVFIPVGFLAGLMQKRATWSITALVGVCISVSVELLQLVLKRGCCETDDVINNTFGCMVGYFILVQIKRIL